VSPAVNVPSVGIGIRLLNTQLNCIRDVEIWNFDVGIDFPAGFTGYTTIERFEITACTTGIRMRDGSNGVLISSGSTSRARPGLRVPVVAAASSSPRW
jgi:hypothetical protein